MSKQFKTHVIDLFARINIKEENVKIYCTDNACSKQMTKRLMNFYRFKERMYLDNERENLTVENTLKDFEFYYRRINA